MSALPPDREADVIELLRAIDVQAPASLRQSTERLLTEHSRSRSARAGGARPSLALRAGASLALLGAVVAIVLVVALAGSSRSSSLQAQVQTLALRPSTSAAPAESSRRRDQLAAAVEGLAFPYWGERFGWRSSGSRSDRVAGRSVSTVFYTDGAAQRIGYAILAGASPAVSGGSIVKLGGTPYRVISSGTDRTVLWTRDGHLCVVAGRGVSSATLLRLASWDYHSAAA
jgi:hypothetical protein